MFDTQITLTGLVGGEVTLRELSGDRCVASFRLACTPSRFRDGEWVRGTPTWHTVKVWNRLARNVVDSLHTGEPVIVHGRLVADSWEREGKAQTSFEVVATSVGHDLSQGTTLLVRPEPAARPSTQPATEPATDPAAEHSAGSSAEPGAGDRRAA